MLTSIDVKSRLQLACVARVSVRFRSKERGQNRKSRSSVFLCSETKRKRLLSRLVFNCLFLGKFRGVKGCSVLQIFSAKQQMLSFELYFCCSCCVFRQQFAYFQAKRVKGSVILYCTTKTRQPRPLGLSVTLLTFFASYAYHYLMKLIK